MTQFEQGGTDNKATIILPTDLANGLYEMRLVAAGGGASNVRTLEVVPFVAKVDPTVDNNVHRLSVTGARTGTKNSPRSKSDGVSALGNAGLRRNVPVALVRRR